MEGQSSSGESPRRTGKDLSSTRRILYSLIVKPLSAITPSPSSNRFKIPHLFTISLSLIDHVYSLEMNDTAALGVIPTRPLKVVALL